MARHRHLAADQEAAVAWSHGPLAFLRRAEVATRTFARRSALAAGLAGIGAAFLTSAVLTAVTNELWFLRIVITDGPPPRVDELLLLKWFAGSFVAARLGAKRAAAVVGVYALAVAALTILRFAIEPALQCALVPHPDCPPSALEWITGTPWVVEGLRGHLWILPGLLLGVLAARTSRVRIPLSSGLAALSVFAIGIVVANYLTWVARYSVCFSSDFTARCIDPEYLFRFATHIALGAVASRVLIRVGGTRRDALILGGILSLAYLPAPVHQAALIWGDGIPAVLGNSGALAGVLTFVLLSLRAHSGRGHRWRSGRVRQDGTPPMEPSASGAPRVIPPDALSASAAAQPPLER